MLEQLRREKTLDRDFQRGLGKVAYHAACHLRAQKIGFPGARVLGVLPDTEVEVIEERGAIGVRGRRLVIGGDIPIGTLRDWEQARKHPDAPALAYLRVIAREPDVTARALAVTG